MLFFSHGNKKTNYADTVHTFVFPLHQNLNILLCQIYGM